MANEPPEITALNDNSSDIEGAVNNNLPSFANDLVRKGFIARDVAWGIVGMLGVTEAQKVGKLMGKVHAKINGAKDQAGRRAWFDSFVDIFSHSKAYEQLVRNLRASLPGPPPQVTDDGGQGASSTSSGERDDMCYTDWLTLPCDEDTHTASCAEAHIEDRSHLWDKEEIRVYFMNVDDIPTWWKDSDGDRITKREVLKIANEWHECDKRVVPKFVQWDAMHESDIRVAFIVYPYSGNSRSAVGRNAHTKFKEKPTMYLYLDPTKEEKKFRRKPQRYKRTIRHEFGHALGLEHEHQHPEAPPQYDHEALKSHLMQVYDKLSEAEIEEKIKRNWEIIIHSPRGARSNYDRDSVMHYVTAVVRKLPLELSAGDRKFIKEIYSQANPRRQSENFARNEETPMETEDSGRNGQRNTGGNETEGVIAADSGSQPQTTATEPQAVTDGAATNAKTPEDFAKFGRPDLRDLMNYVGVDLQAQWTAIALELGLKKSAIAAIQENHRGAVNAAKKCMMDVFTEWEKTMVSEYSWKHLAEVLCSNNVEERSHLTYLYEELSKKKKTKK